MITTIFFKSLLTFFAIYGFVQILKDVYCFCIGVYRDKEKCTFVIKVKNCENSLEYTVRMLIWNFLSSSSGGYIPEILIVDMGSDDMTGQIAKNLSCEYSFIYYTTYELYEKSKGNKDEI
ncbi:MAG: hypothetical protein IKV88_07385 [Clostridia bacterium]|nr:hypothetical protein [Clostridia bacterium]